MHLSEAYHWLVQSHRRQRVIETLNQPLTVTQLAHKVDLRRHDCSRVLWELRTYELVYCVNPAKCKCRLYWLTPLGHACQAQLQGRDMESGRTYCPPDEDWDLYSSLCFPHRAAILKALNDPMQANPVLQPATLRRLACRRDPGLRMSANNVHDVINYLASTGVVSSVHVKGKYHPRYELTDTGKRFQLLLLKAGEHP